MDPDQPVPSIEQDGVAPGMPPTTVSTNNNHPANTTTQISSPHKAHSKTPLSHPNTPSARVTPKLLSRANTPSHERQKTPTLQLRRSTSNLSINRGSTPLLRRTSSNLNPDSPSVPAKVLPTMPDPPKPEPITAGSVAREYFSKELDGHSTAQTKVAVFVHDSCYGHRFSRPKTSKMALSTIVERPERIHATLLGASVAYVRMGDRHAEGRFGPHPHRDVGSVSAPPFVLRKTSRSVPLHHAAVTHVHGTKWMEELQIMCDSAEGKLAMNGKELVRPIGYGKDERGKPLPKLHEGDLYLCAESLAALQGCLGGVCDAVDTVFDSTIVERAFVCIRPPGHHCSSDYPSGFCWLNNVHVGIAYAATTHGLTHAAIIDFDLHHGDGSQTITWNHNRDAPNQTKHAPAYKKTPIGYYSLHDINSYPCEYGDEEKVQNASLCLQNAHGQSIWNVHLEPWTSLEEFWRLYEARYLVLLEKARSFLRHQAERLRAAGTAPKAAIFLSAGFDASQWEGAGMQRHNVNVPTEFYARFTRDTVELANEVGLGVDGRVISVLEGGYSDRALASGVMSHLCGLTGVEKESSLSSGISGIDLSADNSFLNTSQSPVIPYEASWWSEENLRMLEAIVAGNLPPPPLKKKDKQPGDYSSPTHASTARMTNQARERKSLSSQLETRRYLDSATPEPPPEVDWTIAAYELSRLLIPSDRQTLSCRHDELNAEATRVRRERQSTVGLVPTEERMQLRDRKTRPPTTDADFQRASSRTSNRRITIAAVNDLPDPMMGQLPDTRTRRRSSAASSILSSFQDMKLEDRGLDNISVKGGSTVSVSRGTSTAPTVMKPPVVRKIRTSAVRKSRSGASSPIKDRDLATAEGSSPTLSSGNIASRRPSSNNRSSTKPIQNSGADNSVNDAMDELTSGMKKVSIKLKMPTPEQHAANQKKLEEEKQKKVRAPRKPPVPKMVKTKAPAPSQATTKVVRIEQNDLSHAKDTDVIGLSQSEIHPHQSNAPDTASLPSTPQTAISGTQPHSDPSSVGAMLMSQDERAPPLHSHPISPPSTGATTDPAMSTDAPLVDPVTSHSYQPLHTNDHVPQQPSTSTTVNMAPPTSASTKKTKSDLPVFTSSSPIPFSSRDNDINQG